jgi:hypothetical protein
MSAKSAALDNMCRVSVGTSNDDMNKKLDDITVVNILMDLGPSCTTNAATFRDALRLATQKLPSGRLGCSCSSNGGGGAITLKEEEIARLIYFFADVGARQRKDGDNSSNNNNNRSRTSSSSSPHWNLDVVSQVLTEDIITSSNSLNWSLVARSFDFAEFKIHDTSNLEMLLKLYAKASGGKILPMDQIVRGDWMNKEGQLTLLRSLLLVPSSVYKFPLTEDEALDAAATLAVASPDTTTGNTDATTSSPCLNPSGFACGKFLHQLLSLCDDNSKIIHDMAREVIVTVGLQSCPEILFCAIVRLQLSVQAELDEACTIGEQNEVRARAKAGMKIKAELMRQLIPLFFYPKQLQANNNNNKSGSGGVDAAKNMLGGIRRLWEISSSTVLAACTEAYKISSTLEDQRDTVSYQCTLLRKAIPTVSNKPDDWTEVVTLSKDPEFALVMAAHMADNNMLDFPTFLSDRVNSLGKNVMAIQTVLIISRMYKHAKSRCEGLGSDGTVSLILSLENLAALLRLLTSFNAEALGQVIPNTDMTCAQQGKLVLDKCMQMFPNLATLPTNPPGSNNSGGGNHPDEIEEQANSYFQKIYQSEESAREVVDMMKEWKASGNSRENDIYACIIHNLLDEYRFFSKYPEKELRITGILYGLLIKEELVSSITLGTALRYILEALRKHPNQSVQSGKMFRFGMFALEHFKERLPEWPQYCSQILEIGHLREVYAPLIGEIETAVAVEDSQSAGSSSAGPTAPTSVSSDGSVLGREISVSSSSMDGQRSQPATAPLNSNPTMAPYYQIYRSPSSDSPGAGGEGGGGGGGGNQLDEIEEQANAYFLKIYQSEESTLEVVEMMKEWKASGKSREDEIFACMIHNLFDEYRFFSKYPEKELRITGTLFGLLIKEQLVSSITLGIALRYVLEALRKHPHQSPQSGKMFRFGMWALEHFKERLPEWPRYCSHIVQIGHLREGYAALVGEIETAVAMEVEDSQSAGSSSTGSTAPTSVSSAGSVPSNITVTSGVVPNSQCDTAPAPLLSPDEASCSASTSGDSAKSKSDEEPQQTRIPNLSSYVQINPNLARLFEQGRPLSTHITMDLLKRSVPIAVDIAIREIIQPVVERSVSIACITSKAMVTKDFAMEADENKMQKAGQLMVANLAGSLALATCREPLYTGIANNLRRILSNAINEATGNTSASTQLGESEKNALKKCCAICASDNVELGCSLIQKAATERAVRKLDDIIAPQLQMRKDSREKKGQLYYDMSIFGSESQRYPRELPDMLRPKPSGLRPEQLLVYDAFQRIPHHPAPTQSSSGQSTGDASPVPIQSNFD